MSTRFDRAASAKSEPSTSPAPDATSTLSQLIAATSGGPAAISRLRARIRQDRNVSAGYLGLGFVVLGGLLMVRGLVSLGWSWSGGPFRWLTLLAWGLLIVLFIGAVLAAKRNGGIIPGRLSRLLTGTGVLCIAVDLAAFTIDGGRTALYPTTMIGFGACLLACLPLQPLRRSVVGAVCLAVGGGGALVVGYLFNPSSLSAGVTGLLLGLTPVVAGISMIGASDRYLGRKIDRAVTESLVTASAVGHGMGSVSELRRLDSAAETLLASVSRLPADHPIDADTAAKAELLGDDLRLALLSDHEQTWLQIAVTESERLSRSVTIDDPGLLAATLEPGRRRNLLALTWLCAATATAPVLELAFAGSAGAGVAPLTVVFALTDTRRRGIDPAVWPLFDRLGRYTIKVGADRALVRVDLG
ncbi:hypothetical protein B7R22_13000 [Subtercola boreus]|uniref:Uncharacterized protein n=1 Tax=Subtercola boreus TaxID=120213 RepID=A0A3E0VUY3_9MICO|nr:hypothetical protein [Subtercola boreus]RFA13571.1 hypothetical protein B7R22_13000 [Subtercola boreus]